MLIVRETAHLEGAVQGQLTEYRVIGQGPRLTVIAIAT
jgi:hypothetical protein